MTDSQRMKRTQTQPAVITLPAELDLTNTHHLGGDLGSALACGATVVQVAALGPVGSTRC